MTILCSNPLKQYQEYQTEIEEEVLNVLRCGHYILGEKVLEFEERFSDFQECGYSVGVANGTDALEIALKTLNIGAGDEVITVSHTAVATISAICSSGAKPILIDIDAETFCLDPKQLLFALSKKTKAILPVHIYGMPCDMDGIMSFAKKHNLFVIEDCSQAHGARFRGKRVGTFGDMACFSCYPTKNLGAYGDAGVVFSKDHGLATKARQMREYGWKTRNNSKFHGRNSRLDEIQAAILSVKLRHLDKNNAKRIKIAKRYEAKLRAHVKTPIICNNSDHVFHLFVIRLNERDKLLEMLRHNQVFAGIHYPIPVHMQDGYKGAIEYKLPLHKTEIASNQILSLPIYPELLFEEVDKISDLISRFLIERK